MTTRRRGYSVTVLHERRIEGLYIELPIGLPPVDRLLDGEGAVHPEGASRPARHVHVRACLAVVRVRRDRVRARDEDLPGGREVRHTELEEPTATLGRGDRNPDVAPVLAGGVHHVALTRGVREGFAVGERVVAVPAD